MPTSPYSNPIRTWHYLTMPKGPQGQKPPWLHLLEPMQKAWRKNELLKGNNPDPYIEEKLVEAGVWPSKTGDETDA